MLNKVYQSIKKYLSQKDNVEPIKYLSKHNSDGFNLEDVRISNKSIRHYNPSTNKNIERIV